MAYRFSKKKKQSLIDIKEILCSARVLPLAEHLHNINLGPLNRGESIAIVLTHNV